MGIAALVLVVVLRSLAFLPEIIENCDIIDTYSFFLDAEKPCLDMLQQPLALKLSLVLYVPAILIHPIS